MNNYLSVCMFQLKVHLDCDSEDEYLIESDEICRQLEKAFHVIEEFQPDISLFPEMTYWEKYEETYQKLSVSKIIVAGSYYKNGINTTVIFENGEKQLWLMNFDIQWNFKNFDVIIIKIIFSIDQFKSFINCQFRLQTSFDLL